MREPDESVPRELMDLRRKVAWLEQELKARELLVAERARGYDTALSRSELSDANFRTVIEQSAEAVFIHRDDVILYVNPTMLALLGLVDARDLIGQRAVGLLDPTHRRTWMDHVGTSPHTSLTLRWMRPGGSLFSTRVRCSEIFIDGERATLVQAHDLTTAQHLAEQHRVLFENSPLGKYIFDVETFRLLDANASIVALYGYERSQLLGMSLIDLKLPEDLHQLEGMRDKDDEGLRHVGVVKHRKSDGSLLEVDITSQPMMYNGRRARICAVRDVTEERRIEEQLRQSQKMDAIGRLAGGVAHDFNNILAVILTDAELALTELGEGHAVYPDIKEIQAAGMRAAGLTRQLLTFSRQQPTRSEPLELNAIITALQRMLCRIIGEDIHVYCDLAEDVGSIEADRGHVEQVLLNLVVNARDAMPHGGNLTIETRNVELEALQAQKEGLQPGSYVRLVVSDNGVGMDRTTQERLFEPFFTTKEVGKGTGLGLATVFGIIKHAAGSISVQSVTGCGTSFSIYLPRIDSRSVPVPPESKVLLSRDDETILVVEDDEQVRRVVCRLLRSKGYTVLEARNAEIALELLSQRTEAVDLILTDLVMPDIDGRTMAAMVQERNPRAKVLYMSGYTEHAAVKGAGLGPMEHFIHKPFTVRELALAVRNVIMGRRTTSREMAAVRLGGPA